MRLGEVAAAQPTVHEWQNLDAEHVSVFCVERIVGDSVEQAIKRQLPILRGELGEDLHQRRAAVFRALRPTTSTPCAAAMSLRARHREHPYELEFGKVLPKPNRRKFQIVAESRHREHPYELEFGKVLPKPNRRKFQIVAERRVRGVKPA
jgi:hypothetical protein